MDSNDTNLKHVMKFAISGVAAFGVDAAVLYAGLALGLPLAVARIPSVLGAIVTTWLINRYWTFKTSRKPSFSEFSQYAGAMGFGLMINYGTFLLAISLSPIVRANPIIGLAIATVSAMTVNFLTARFLLRR